MTNQVPTNPIQFAGAGNPGNASNTPEPQQQKGAGEQQQDTGAKYLTPEDAEALFNNMFERKAQSITDKTTARVQKVLQAAQQQGLQITPQQAQAMLDVADAENQQQAQPQQPQTTPQPSRQQPPSQPAQSRSEAAPDQAPHPVLATADAMIQASGISFDDGDPELELIDKETKNPLEFLNSIDKAIKEKQARLQKAGDPARMPSLSSQGRPANAVSQIKDPNELWKMARSQG